MRSATNFYKSINLLLNVYFIMKFFSKQINKQNKGNSMK